MHRLLRHTKFILSALAVMVISTGAAWSADFVRSGNKVTCGEARFDILSPSLVRMQYAPGGFVDALTAVVTNRNLGDRRFTVSSKDGRVVIKTGKISIAYSPSAGRFTPESLRITWKDGRGQQTWSPGQSDSGNLGGPFGSYNDILDQTKPENKMPEFPAGMLSRSGYYLLDDSSTPVWDAKSAWITPRTDKATQDWYFFAYGTDYTGFFKEYIKLAGRIPMVPRYTFGAWVTDLNFEYTGQKVNEDYLIGIVDRFRKESIPLDLMVLDFGWHLYGWAGGLDWSPIIPDPKAFMKKLHDSGIKVTPNDHPGSGLFYKDTRVAIARQKLNRSASDIQPVEDISPDWAFRLDPSDQGVREQWFAENYQDSGWSRMDAGMPWENVGYPGYDGIAWYRKWISIPKELESGPVHLNFGGVDDEYDIYVNGKLAGHQGGPGNSTYDHLTDSDITPFVRKGGKNLICLRIKDWGNEGGIIRLPAMVSNARVTKTSMLFNLANKEDAQVYMDFHNELVDQGVDFWWIDGTYAEMPGLNSQLWTNKVYYDAQEQHTGQRSFIFSRYGGPGTHRYPGFFTGDCYSNWKTLASEIPYTLKAANTLSPYVTHDISGFIGTLKDDFELYARWVQFGALSPMLRLHSAHENPIEGNVRLPWNYGKQGTDLCRRFFKLRYSLIPYLYTYSREAYDSGMPLTRPLYLDRPELDESYRFDEYLLGQNLLVAPITAPGKDGVAVRDIYLPAGDWTDYFTGRTYNGSRTISYECPLDRMPLFVRQGSIIPIQPDMDYTNQKPLDQLILDVYPGASSTFTLYEDDGLSLNYKNGAFSKTRFALTENPAGRRITIGAAQGRYKGQVTSRGYLIRLHCDQRPQEVVADGKILTYASAGAQTWQWDSARKLAVIRLESRPVSDARDIAVR